MRAPRPPSRPRSRQLPNLVYCQNTTVGRRDFYRHLCLASSASRRRPPPEIPSSPSAHTLRSFRCKRGAYALSSPRRRGLHLLHQDTLDHLHILLNYQWDSKPLLSLVLIGLPDPRRQAAAPTGNRPLYSRIHHRFALGKPPPRRHHRLHSRSPRARRGPPRTSSPPTPSPSSTRPPGALSETHSIASPPPLSASPPDGRRSSSSATFSPAFSRPNRRSGREHPTRHPFPHRRRARPRPPQMIVVVLADAALLAVDRVSTRLRASSSLPRPSASHRPPPWITSGAPCRLVALHLSADPAALLRDYADALRLRSKTTSPTTSTPSESTPVLGPLRPACTHVSGGRRRSGTMPALTIIQHGEDASSQRAWPHRPARARRCATRCDQSSAGSRRGRQRRKAG